MLSKHMLIVNIEGEENIIKLRYCEPMGKLIEFVESSNAMKYKNKIADLVQEAYEYRLKYNGWIGGGAEFIMRDLVSAINDYYQELGMLPEGFYFNFAEGFGVVPGECKIGVVPN